MAITVIQIISLLTALYFNRLVVKERLREMKCIHCQKELPNGALFCKYCGKKQEGASVTQEKVFSDFPNHIDHQTSGDALNTKEPSPTPVLQEISSSGNAESQVFDLNEAMQEYRSVTRERCLRSRDFERQTEFVRKEKAFCHSIPRAASGRSCVRSGYTLHKMEWNPGCFMACCSSRNRDWRHRLALERIVFLIF